VIKEEESVGNTSWFFTDVFRILKGKTSNLFKKNELVMYSSYDYTDDYDHTVAERFIPTTSERILNMYKDSDFDELILSSEFNGKLYPFFDIDDYNSYYKFYNNTKLNFVSFQSSPGHYWVIVDKPFKNFKEFLNDDMYNEWLVYSDIKYTNMAYEQKKFYIRGLFDTLDRQPSVFQRVGIFDFDFKIYIDKMEKFFQTESLNLSIIRYKDSEMLLQYERIKKLERITKN
jgi:hypothetical protein